MKIVNPRSSVGNTPLATTWYVDTNVQNLKENVFQSIDSVSAALSGEIANKEIDLKNYDRAIARTFAKYFTGNHEMPDSEIAQSFYDKVNEYIEDFTKLSHNGYAWLNGDGKVDPSLMPDLSVIKPVPVNRSSIYAWFDSGSPGTIDMSGELAKLPNEEERAKYVVERYISVDQGLFKDYGTRVQTGDLVVITCDTDITLPEDGSRNFFAKKYMAGAWVVTNEVTDSSDAHVVKISFNQGEIIEINNIGADQEGAVRLSLADIYRYSDAMRKGDDAKISADLAWNLLSIGSVPASADYTSGIPGLDGINGSRLAFMKHTGTQDPVYIPYATLKELKDLYDEVHTTISGAISGGGQGITEIWDIIGETSSSIVLSSNTIAEALDALSGKTYASCEECNKTSEALNGKAIKIEETLITWNAEDISLPGEDFKKDLYPHGDEIRKFYRNNSAISGKVLAVYEVNGNIEEQVYPDITYYPSANFSTITAYSYSATAAATYEDITETLEGKTWKVYFTTNISWNNETL